MQIIYIHGFNSGPNSNTGLKLKSKYTDAIIVSYDFKNANTAKKDIEKVIIENITKDILLIGSSLGGFWANYMAEEYNLPCILINPSIDPDVSLMKYIGLNKNYSSNIEYTFTKEDFKSYSNYHSKKTVGLFKSIILSKNDKILDYKQSLDFFKDYKIHLNNDGHALEDFNLLEKCIEEAKLFIAYSNLTPNNSITENYKNLFTKEDKLKYADDVWDLLNKAYQSIGGIKGNGFSSKDDMINNIPFWKLKLNNNKIEAVVLYKDKNGRKSVAGASDGTITGKKEFIKIKNQDLELNRSYAEISSAMLAVIYKNNKNLIEYCIPYNNVVKILNEPILKPDDNDPEILKYPDLKDFFYKRKIGEEWITKLMIGTPFNKIV